MNQNRTSVAGRDHSVLAVAKARRRGLILTEGNEVNKGSAQIPNNKNLRSLCFLL